MTKLLRPCNVLEEILQAKEKEKHIKRLQERLKQDGIVVSQEELGKHQTL